MVGEPSKLIEAWWQSYRKDVLAGDLSAVQSSQCKRAFFAGAGAAALACDGVKLKHRHTFVADANNVNATLIELLDEVQRFVMRVDAGGA